MGKENCTWGYLLPRSLQGLWGEPMIMTSTIWIGLCSFKTPSCVLHVTSWDKVGVTERETKFLRG